MLPGFGVFRSAHIRGALVVVLDALVAFVLGALGRIKAVLAMRGDLVRIHEGRRAKARLARFGMVFMREGALHGESLKGGSGGVLGVGVGAEASVCGASSRGRFSLMQGVCQLSNALFLGRLRSATAPRASKFINH